MKFIKTLVLNSHLLFIILLIAPFPGLQAQDAGTAEILELLESDKKRKTTSDSDDSGYKSFVQNEYMSVTKQLSELRYDEKQDIFFSDLQKKRMELATQLCVNDKRACFLIEEYRDFNFIQPNSFDEIELYGLDIFSGYVNDFSFYDSLPLSSNYVLRVGDIVKVQLFGSMEFDEELKIDRTGAITVEGIGNIQLAGLPFDAALTKLENIISEKFFGTEISISMDKVRAMQVFVLGNVQVPGTYVINTFGTILNALISSGGVKSKSSLRSINVVRGNQTVAEIDLYDVLIKGNLNFEDLSLQDGDSIIINGLENTVSLIGEINRPAIYEFIEGETLSDLLEFGLGTTPRSDLENISVTRVLGSGKTTVLNPKNLLTFQLQSGDQVKVNSSFGEQINYISLIGAIRNAGEFSLNGSQFLGEFIDITRDLQEHTYTGIAVIKRFNNRSKSYELFTIDLTSQDSIDKVKVFSRDKVFILSKEDIAFLQSNTLKAYVADLAEHDPDMQPEEIDPELLSKIPEINQNLEKNPSSNISNNSKLECLKSLDALSRKPLIDFLESKFKIFNTSNELECTSLFSTHNELLPLIVVKAIPVMGNVRFPGLYPVSNSLSALDLFYLAGSFLYSPSEVDLSFEIGTQAAQFNSFQASDLPNVTNLTYLKSKITLDRIYEGYVTLVGEFDNPGTYSISNQETLSSLYKRAGGLTLNAYPVAGVLTRQSVLAQESKALDRAKAELSDILSSAVTGGYLDQDSTDLVGLISLMTNLSNSSPLGRLVTELDPDIINSNASKDLYLEPGDVIYIPPMQNVITIVGQVLNPVTVPYNSSLDFQDYLDLAGGIKGDADKRKIYAILPNGTSLRDSSGYLGLNIFRDQDLLPGSTIIVPRKARPMDSLALVQTVSPILASLSVTAASIAAISNN
jgi:protein involved in polysaccharide export with SLBB domain